MANVIKTMFNSMENQKHTLDHVSTNKHCLPHPTELESWYLWVVLGIYVAQVGLYYIEAYALRLRRVIASFFYRRKTCYNCDPVYTSEDTQTSDTSSSSEED
uniref:Dendritic cell-specific transmembrane protein-like domain-containing protein n=1 Tax=Branchiostoma floridae TaxID=7739 RepID=C3ZJD5_BRAFL|eukprot:XP_002591266.1 hypothetical protein BRAFLDRAFT_76703 [Branchiostoma floridae]